MTNKPETCAGCKYQKDKPTFLGPKPYCQRFKCLRNVRCLDWRKK